VQPRPEARGVEVSHVIGNGEEIAHVA
jgi:hypothetical protein